VTGNLVGDQSCGVVDTVAASIVLSGMMGIGGGGVVSLPPPAGKPALPDCR